MRTRCVAPVLLACLATACTPPAAPDITVVRVSLPLGLDTAELRQLRVTQAGQVREVELPADGAASVQVLAGVPVDVLVTILGFEPPSTFVAYTAARQLVAAPGPTTLDLELAAADARAGSVVPAFVSSTLVQPFDTTITVTDVDTGHQFTGYVPRTGETFTLPAGRLIELTAASPTDPGGAASMTIPSSDFVPGTRLELTPPADTTPPVLDVRASPPYLPPAAGAVTVSIHAGEPLDPARLAVTIGGVPACTPSWLDEADATCVIDAALLGAGPTDVAVAAADAAGNTSTASVHLRDVTGLGLAITGVRTYPAQADPSGTFFLGFDVVGLQPCAGSVPVLVTALATDNPFGATAPPGTFVDITPSLLQPAISATLVDLSLDTTGAPGQATLWGVVNGTPSLLPGTYRMTLTSDGSCGVDANAVFDVRLGPPSPRWVTSDGVLVYAERTDTGGEAGFGFPVGPGYGLGFLSDDPTVIDIPTGTFPAGPQIVGVGHAVVTLTPSPTDPTPLGTAIFDVAPGPALAFLQDDGDPTTPHGWVLVSDATLARRVDLDAAIGAPLRLLWDPGRDALVAVGTLGVEDLGPTPPALVAGLPAAVADAALVPDAGGGAGSVVLLLADARVVTVPLASKAAGSPLAIDQTGCKIPPTRLAYAALGGELTAFGGDCPRALRLEGGALRVRGLQLGSAFSTAAADPRSDTLVALSGTAAWSVHTAAGGSTTGLFTDPNKALIAADAVALDAGNGKALVATYDPLSNGTTLLEYDPLDASSSTALPSALPGRMSRLLVDATSQEVIGISTDPTPQLVVAPLSFNTATARLRVAPPPFEARPVRDAVLRGPQVLSFSPHAAAPGGVLTIVGTGFAGGGKDEVFVQGLRAETLTSTATLVVARVPASLGAFPSTRSLTLGVRSHGRLVQTGAELTLVREPAIFEAAPPSSYVCTTTPCPALYEPPTLLATDAGSAYVSYPSAGLFDPYFSPLLGVSMTAPTTVGASRVVGQIDELDPTGGTVVGHSWVEYRPDGNRARKVAMEQGATIASTGPIAGDPAERLIAVAADGGVRLAWAASYADAAAPTPMPASASSLAFTRDGRALVVIGTSLMVGYDALQLWVVALDVAGELTPSAPPPRIPVGFAPGCPTTFMAAPHLLPSGATGAASVAVVYEAAAALGGPRTVVVGAFAPGTVTVKGVAQDGLVLDCAPSAVPSTGISAAALSPSGRLLAVSMYNQLVLLSPASRRVSATAALLATPSSLAFGFEPSSGSGPLYTAYDSPQPQLDIQYTR